MSNLKAPYILWEVANTHGGDVEAIREIVSEAATLGAEKAGIKFQILSAEGLSLPDFYFYENYQNLEVSTEDWKKLFVETKNKGLDVWVDLFDITGVGILKDHAPLIYGFKLQASVLNNYEVFTSLTELSLPHAVMLLNTSGYSLEEIEVVIERFSRVEVKEIVLQIGFQDYPTLIEDCGLEKIGVLRERFPHLRISIADHCSGENEFAKLMPVAGWLLGAEIIEKHFCVDREKAVFDGVSAVEPDDARQMVSWVQSLSTNEGKAFVGEKEAEYLEKSVQTPITKREILKGELLAASDFIYRRTSQEGISMPRIASIQKEGRILAKDCARHTTISDDYFQKARVGTIVACRLKSSRLKRKAFHKLNGVTSLERCLQNCEMFEGVDELIVATSDLEEDAEIETVLPGGVSFWKGDAEDVISRYLGACERYNLDVIVRVTADCPVMFPEIIPILLEEHFASGADYTAPVECAVGSAPEIYSVSALKRVMELKGSAEYSEYMTWYMRNNADIFKVHLVDLPPELVRGYRLTLDYEKDAEMFSRLYKLTGDTPTGERVISVLESHPDVAEINQGLTLRYKTDAELIETLNRETRIMISDDD